MNANVVIGINSDTSFSLSTASMVSIKLHSLSDEDKRLENCRALSSDEDSFCEAEREVNKDGQGQGIVSFSSGYSSVQSVSPSSTCSSSSPLMHSGWSFSYDGTPSGCPKLTSSWIDFGL